MLPGAVGIGKTVVERMLGRQKWHDLLPWRITAEISDQVPKVVLLTLPYGAVGEEDVGASARQFPNRVIGVDPGIDSGSRIELGSWRSEFNGGRRRRAVQ